VTPALQALLDLPDDELNSRLIGFIRQSGLKFRSRKSFDRIGWKDGPDPIFAKSWKRQGDALVPSPDPMIWDLRAPLLRDEALACCCVLMWRRSRQFGAQWIGGVETAAIPLIAGMLAVNRAAGGPPLNGFYLRKQRKSSGLRRLLEGVPPPRGASVLLVDDLLNKGISKKQLVTYCRRNDLRPAGLLVVVDVGSKGGHELFASVCPIESLLTKQTVLGRLPVDEGEPAVPSVIVDTPPRKVPRAEEMKPEDVELVRLARDAVVFATLSGGNRSPTLGEDMRGSAGYLPFLGRYLEERGPVFTRISKREFKNGVWFNRLRGCQAVGLFDPNPGTFAEMTIKSAVVSATRARKVKSGPARFHKPVWPEEVGDLSLFVYLVEKLIPTNARTVDELVAEGHEVKGWGLIAQGQGYRGVVCGDLDDVPDVARQVAVACRKMQNNKEICPQAADQVTFIRMKGRWLWDPGRSKADFF